MTLLKERDLTTRRGAMRPSVGVPGSGWQPGSPLTKEALASETDWVHIDLEFNDPRSVMDTITEMIQVGRRDTALGRLVEGHVNALQLMHRYGNGIQQEQARTAARDRRVYGVWNADHRDNPLRTVENRLRGAKAFASGAGLLTHAIVTTEASDPRHVQMWVVELDEYSNKIDKLWWNPVGMQRSETHIVSFDERAPAPAERLGRPGDYMTQPDFSGGALRFAAVQAGSVAGLYDAMVEELISRGRAEHSLQRRRIAEGYTIAQGAINAVCATARRYDIDEPMLLARVDAARHSVLEAAESMLSLVQRAVGLNGLMHPHPIATRVTDLMTYIRQPNPDGSADNVAEAVIRKGLRPGIEAG